MVYSSMINLSLLFLFSFTIDSIFGFDQETDWPSAKSVYDFHAIDLFGNSVSLNKYKDHVLVIFNGPYRSCPVSAKAFKQLQKLHDNYGESVGLKIAVFVIDGLVKPAGSREDIAEFANTNKLSFDFYDKIVSNGGDDVHPIYKWLKIQMLDQEKIMPSTKILIDKSGKVVGKFPYSVSIEELENAIKQYL